MTLESEATVDEGVLLIVISDTGCELLEVEALWLAYAVHCVV